MGFAFRFVHLPWGKMDVFMADRLNFWPIQPGRFEAADVPEAAPVGMLAQKDVP